MGDVIFHLIGLHGLNYHYFNSILPGGGYIGVLYVIWVFDLLYCRHMIDINKSMIGAAVVFLAGYLFVRLIALRFAYSPDYSDIISVVLYYCRALYSVVAGNLIYHIKEKYNKLKLDFPITLTILLIALIIFYVKDDYIRNEQFVCLITIIITINLLVAKPVICNSLLTIVGKCSYEIYLVHVVLYAILPLVMPSGFLQLIMMVCITGFAAPIIHLYLSGNWRKIVTKLDSAWINKNDNAI